MCRNALAPRSEYFAEEASLIPFLSSSPSPACMHAPEARGAHSFPTCRVWVEQKVPKSDRSRRPPGVWLEQSGSKRCPEHSLGKTYAEKAAQAEKVTSRAHLGQAGRPQEQMWNKQAVSRSLEVGGEAWLKISLSGRCLHH